MLAEQLNRRSFRCPPKKYQLAGNIMYIIGFKAEPVCDKPGQGDILDLLADIAANGEQ
jgi:hypothetical protein